MIALPSPLPLAAAALLLLGGCGGPARIDLEPASLKLYGRGQQATLHATPRTRAGQPDQAATCAWSSSDPGVATVVPRHNEVVVASVKPGTATITCAIGSLRASATAAVRSVTRVEVKPAQVALALGDDRAASKLEVTAFDEEGSVVPDRLVLTRCDDEAVCRGDARGQLWPTGPGRSRATVAVEGVEATVPVVVTDARTDATRPQVLQRGYMEELERQIRRREAAEAAKAGRP